MRLKNILIAVENIERSKELYQRLFGLRIKNDFEENVIFMGGLVLQEKAMWEAYTGRLFRSGNTSELFFETSEFDAFLEKLNSFPEVTVIRGPMVNVWGKRVILLQDPDEHWIEVAEE